MIKIVWKYLDEGGSEEEESGVEEVPLETEDEEHTEKRKKTTGKRKKKSVDLSKRWGDIDQVDTQHTLFMITINCYENF